MSEALDRYNELALELERLWNDPSVPETDPRVDAVWDAMDEPWLAMTEEERDGLEDSDPETTTTRSDQ